MKVVKRGDDVESLINELAQDLRGEEVTRVARMPQPRVGERYRDVVKNLFSNAGMAQVVVVLETREGVRKVYVFLLRGEPVEGAGSYLDCPVVVDGHLIKASGGSITHIQYSPKRYEEARELLDRIEDMANLYRLSEDKLRMKQIELTDFYDWMLVGG